MFQKSCRAICVNNFRPLDAEAPETNVRALAKSMAYTRADRDVTSVSSVSLHVLTVVDSLQRSLHQNRCPAVSHTKNRRPMIRPGEVAISGHRWYFAGSATARRRRGYPVASSCQ